ncbi:hypothetical protein [Thalassotalea fusca]
MLKNKLLFTVKKEFWEYQKILLVLPIVLALLFVIMPIFSVVTHDHAIERIFGLAQLVSSQEVHANLSNFYTAAIGFFAIPLVAIGFFVQLFYLISCMYDERRDQSIMFWRSMPVADIWQVAVKFLMGVLLIPAIFVLAATAIYVTFYVIALIVSLVLSVGYDISLWHVWFDFGFITAIFKAFYLILPTALWLLPLFAWLLLASSFAKKAPFLWAVLPIVAIVVVEAVARQYGFTSDMYLTGIMADYFNLAAEFNHMDVKKDAVVYQHGNASIQIDSIPRNIIENKVSLTALLISGAFFYASYWIRTNRTMN